MLVIFTEMEMGVLLMEVEDVICGLEFGDGNEADSRTAWRFRGFDAADDA